MDLLVSVAKIGGLIIVHGKKISGKKKVSTKVFIAIVVPLATVLLFILSIRICYSKHKSKKTKFEPVENGKKIIKAFHKNLNISYNVTLIISITAKK